MTLAGGCHCGACRYELALAEMPKAYACHCLNCQTWSGSAFSEQILLAESALSITGPVVEYDFQSPSGSRSLQRMCGICHVRLYNTNTMRAGLAVVRAGTLDRSDELDVPTHIFVSGKQAWLTLPADAEIFDKAATTEAIVRLFAR